MSFKLSEPLIPICSYMYLQLKLKIILLPQSGQFSRLLQNLLLTVVVSNSGEMNQARFKFTLPPSLLVFQLVNSIINNYVFFYFNTPFSMTSLAIILSFSRTSKYFYVPNNLIEFLVAIFPLPDFHQTWTSHFIFISKYTLYISRSNWQLNYFFISDLNPIFCYLNNNNIHLNK